MDLINTQDNIKNSNLLLLLAGVLLVEVINSIDPASIRQNLQRLTTMIFAAATSFSKRQNRARARPSKSRQIRSTAT